MGEAKRVFNKKMCLLILIAVIGNICLFLYGELAGKNVSDMIFAVKQYENLIQRYENMDLNEALEKVSTEFSNMRMYAKNLVKGGEESTTQQKDITTLDQIQQEDLKQQTAQEFLEETDDGSREIIEYHQSLTKQQQTQLELQMKELKTKLTYLSGYKTSVDMVMENAENMKRFSIFSKQNSFSYNNILRTAKDFERVENTILMLDNDKGADSFVHYNIMYYIAAMLMIAVIYSLFDERENGMWQLVHNTKKGRGLLAVKRLLILTGGSFAILLILYGSTFVVSMLLYGGFSDLKNPVQTFTDFGKFTYTFSKGEYIVRLFLISWLILSALSVILWTLFILFRNRNHTLICTAAFVGIEILVYQKIEVQSVYNAFRYINVVSFLKISDLYSTYINWGFKNYVFSVFSVVMFFLLLLAISAAVFAVFWYAQMRPQTKVSLISRFFMILHSQYQKLFARYPVVLKELHKLVVTGKGVWVIAALIIISVYFSSTGYMTFTDAQKEYDNMYLEHGGKDYSYISSYVEEKQEEYKKSLKVLEEAAAKYEAGEIELKEYTRAVSAFQYQKMAINSIQEYKEKLDYADKIRETKQQEIWLVSDRGYEEIFGKYGEQREFILLIALVIAVMLIVSESIAIEQRTGMYQIIRSSVNGRLPVMIWKISAAILLTIGLTLLVYGIDYVNLYNIYGLPYLQAPTLSLTFMENTWGGLAEHTTIFGWIMIRLFLRILMAIFTMVSAMFVSKIIGKKGNRAIMPVAAAGIILLLWILHIKTGLF